MNSDFKRENEYGEHRKKECEADPFSSAFSSDGFDRNDVFNSSSIDSFVFADGSMLSTTELLARGFDLGGLAGGCDVLLGHRKPEAANDPILLAA